MRTAIYIDGFNLYYGALKNTHFKWLNPKQLCASMFKSPHNIVSVVYCTAKAKPTAGQAIILSCSKGIVKDNGAFALMISGGFVSGGMKTAQGRRMLKSWTIIRIEEACYA